MALSSAVWLPSFQWNAQAAVQLFSASNDMHAWNGQMYLFSMYMMVLYPSCLYMFSVVKPKPRLRFATPTHGIVVFTIGARLFAEMILTEPYQSMEMCIHSSLVCSMFLCLELLPINQLKIKKFISCSYTRYNFYYLIIVEIVSLLK